MHKSSTLDDLEEWFAYTLYYVSRALLWLNSTL